MIYECSNAVACELSRWARRRGTWRLIWLTEAFGQYLNVDGPNGNLSLY